MKKYGLSVYAEQIKTTGEQNNELIKQIILLCGVKESDTGLSLPSLWNLEGDK